MAGQQRYDSQKFIGIARPVYEDVIITMPLDRASTRPVTGSTEAAAERPRFGDRLSTLHPKRDLPAAVVGARVMARTLPVPAILAPNLLPSAAGQNFE